MRRPGEFRRNFLKVFVLLSIVVGFSAAGAGSKQGDALPRQIQYSFTLKNTTNLLIEESHLWVFAPVKKTATQQCSRLESSYLHELIADKAGNQSLHFAFRNFPPYGMKIVTVSADLVISEKPSATSGEDVSAYLKAERYVESDDPELARLAKSLKSPDPVKTVDRIFNWVVGNIRYRGYVSNDRGARVTYSQREGDCTEQMYLFVALCRAAGVPARCIGGYVAGESGVLNPADYHNWSEFHENGVWKIADPLKRVLRKKQSDYIAVTLMGEAAGSVAASFNRFRYQGDGLSVIMN